MSAAASVTPAVRERPILFSGPMVKAILAGTKAQTRRVLDRQPFEREGQWHLPIRKRAAWHVNRELIVTTNKRTKERTEVERDVPVHEWLRRFCPHRVGDRLWVRETWRVRADLDGVRPRDLAPCEPWYCATANGDGDEQPSGCAGGLGKKRPAIFMPRWASRLTLEITDVRVQRLQEISEDDAKAEGVTPLGHIGAGQPVLDTVRGRTHGTHPHVLAYAVAWDTLNDERAPWARNPWVWALSFRRVP